MLTVGMVLDFCCSFFLFFFLFASEESMSPLMSSVVLFNGDSSCCFWCCSASPSASTWSLLFFFPIFARVETLVAQGFWELQLSRGFGFWKLRNYYTGILSCLRLWVIGLGWVGLGWYISLQIQTGLFRGLRFGSSYIRVMNHSNRF